MQSLLHLEAASTDWSGKNKAISMSRTGTGRLGGWKNIADVPVEEEEWRGVDG
jgi:hypothetical protein